MNQKVLIGIIAGLLVLGGFLYLKSEEVNNPEPPKAVAGVEKEPKEETVTKEQETSSNIDFENIEGEIVYYYGSGCSHCLGVNEFLEKNDIISKVNFVKKEVWNNKDNASELSEVAQECGINPGSIGVPFLFADGKCYIGGPDVEGFFSKAAGM